MKKFINNNKELSIVVVLSIITVVLFCFFLITTFNINSRKNIAKQPFFSDYPSVALGESGYYDNWLIHNAKQIKINFTGFPDSITQNDRENILYSARLGPNFADHFRLVELSCGTGCQFFIIVDLLSGKAYDPELATFAGDDFNVLSNLLVLNPPEYINSVCSKTPNNFVIDCKNTVSEYYVWRGDHFDSLGKYRILYDVKKVE
jgi:hypothetical protein